MWKAAGEAKQFCMEDELLNRFLVFYEFVTSRPRSTLVLVGVLYLVVCFVFGMIGASITKYKSGSVFSGFILGFLLWAVGLLLALFIPYRPSELIHVANQRQQRWRDQMRTHVDERTK